MTDITTRKQTADAIADGKRSAAACRWATATLFLQAPYWFEAENSPWACLRDAAPRVLSMTDPCAVCPRWELRSDERAMADDKPETRHALTHRHEAAPSTQRIPAAACDPLLGSSFATVRQHSGHTMRDR